MANATPIDPLSEWPSCTICKTRPGGTASAAISEMSMPPPITTIAIARPRMPSTDTFCSSAKIFADVKNPLRNKEQKMNSAANTTKTISCWVTRKRFIAPLCRDRRRPSFAEGRRAVAGKWCVLASHPQGTWAFLQPAVRRLTFMASDGHFAAITACCQTKGEVLPGRAGHLLDRALICLFFDLIGATNPRQSKNKNKTPDVGRAPDAPDLPRLWRPALLGEFRWPRRREGEHGSRFLDGEPGAQKALCRLA